MNEDPFASQDGKVKRIEGESKKYEPKMPPPARASDHGQEVRFGFLNDTEWASEVETDHPTTTSE